MIEYLWLIPALPLVGAAFNGLLGRRAPKRLVGLVACGTVAAAFAISAAAVAELLRLPPESRRMVQPLFTWIASGDFVARAALALDPLSAVMILVVTGVGSLIHVYSIGYMHAEAGYYRFFAYLNLFMFSMLVLVLADNFLLMFVGWEGVGLCSYLLIGYYFVKKSAGDAGKKAFIVNRIGDVGFVLGVLTIWATFHSVDFSTVFAAIAAAPGETMAAEATVIALLLFVGATGKSAQVPLYVWLPDAMEGPTPVSALIHAATMVTAGVYMVVRAAPIFSRSELALTVVAAVGIFTAVLAATIALVQSDIKRVLAYSTVSQLGYMFTAAGVGAFSAAMFHVMTHAFFKALLFLGAGSVIHALGGEQDLLRMGGLRRHIPITYWTMLLGAAAIAGLPPLAGFFSKDEILWAAWHSGHPVIYAIGLATALLTAFYMFRLIFLAFFGSERMTPEARHHLHESPPTMTVPLVALALLSIVGGWVGLPAWLGANAFEHFLEPSLELAAGAGHGEAGATASPLFAVVAVVAAVAGIVVAYRLYAAGAPAGPPRFAGLSRLLGRKYYVDEIYDALFVRPILVASRDALWKIVDVRWIDGAVNGVGRALDSSANVLKNVQNGLARSYASWILIGAVAVLLYVYVVGRA